MSKTVSLDWIPMKSDLNLGDETSPLVSFIKGSKHPEIKVKNQSLAATGILELKER